MGIGIQMRRPPRAGAEREQTMCTSIRFTDTRGNMFFGRNLDWGCGYGEQVFVTPRNYQRPYVFDKPTRGGYALIGTAIEAEGIPLYFDCGNEKGLAIAGLNFPGEGFAQYEKAPVEGKTNVATYEFPLWVASNFATVDEAEEALRNVAIVDHPVSAQWPSALLHFIIGDATHSIVVEYRADGMHIYHNDVDVLANQPTFDWHRENLRNYISLTPQVPAPAHWDKATLAPYGSGSGMRGIPGDYYSPSRFVRAAYLNSNYPAQESEADNVTRLFKTLGGVSMIKGAALMSDGTFEYTVYTSAFSANTGTYYFTTYNNPTIVSHSLSEVDLDGTALTEFKSADREVATAVSHSDALWAQK